jgi:hypothetical protein
MIADFPHQHTAHCESGVMSTMLRYRGVDVSEPMAFGLSSSLAFAYLPFIKISGMPLVAYRTPPRRLIKGLQKRLGLKMHFERFPDPRAGMDALDRALDAGKLVGVQTSVYWLPYFPPQMRFHFNAHNLLVYGKDGNDYLISDPVLESPVRCPAEDLQKARFARGVLAPKGMMYHLNGLSGQPDLAGSVRASIKSNLRIMTGAPVPLIGLRGVRYLANRVERLGTDRRGQKYAKLFLGHIVRMQEEIGTGGAGFRFMYASFLQEAGELIGSARLKEASAAMTNAGDTWRAFASQAVKVCKDRDEQDYRGLARLLRACAIEEHAVWQMLKSA